MKLSYALTLLSGGSLASGFHAIDAKAASFLFFVGAAALVLGAIFSTEADR